MKVVVQGLWHLGSVTAAALAARGHDVTGFDRDAAVIDHLSAGQPPVFEPGLKELVVSGLAAGRLRFVARSDQLPADVEVLWVTHDTPVDEDDVADVEWVLDQVTRTLDDLPPDTIVLISSQLPVGTTHRLAMAAAAAHPHKRLRFACSPENLRLGKALDVFLNADRFIVGADEPETRDGLSRLFRPISDRIEWMSVTSAEMTKHAINAFLATSVVFANEIASICETVGADAKEVERGLKTEQRIGPKAYLSPGAAFAGGTLARDVAFLRDIGASKHVAIPLLDSIRVSNDHHKGWVREKLTQLFPSLSGVHVAIWGLTYKPDTDTLRRSLTVELCDWLLGEGAVLHVHDVRVSLLPPTWTRNVERFADPAAALPHASVLVIGTEHSEYKLVDAEQIAATAPGIVVLDSNRFLAPLQNHRGIRYVAVGTV